MNKKTRLILLLLPLTVLLTGCAQISTEYHSIWNSFGLLFARGIVFFSDLGLDSLGVGIIIMTIIIRLLIMPLYAKQIKSQEEMKKIQPKVDKINKKYENKTSQEDKLKKNQEIQTLYKEEGINPLAGCLPLFIQMPILFVFYDSLNYLVPSKAVIDAAKANGTDVIYGLKELNVEHIDTAFFGLNLGNPVILFAILAAATTWLTTYASQIGTDMSSDNPAATSLKIMMWVFPIMIFFMGLQLPGALSIYWVVGNLFSIFQTLYYRRTHIKTAMDKKKINKVIK